MSEMLTDDEFAILLIAAEGRSMLPIGRWQKPVEDLVARGLMIRHDPSNNTISPAGREALEQRERDDVDAIRAVGQKLARTQAAPEAVSNFAADAIVKAEVHQHKAVLITGYGNVFEVWIGPENQPLIQQTVRR